MISAESMSSDIETQENGANDNLQITIFVSYGIINQQSQRDG